MANAWMIPTCSTIKTIIRIFSFKVIVERVANNARKRRRQQP